MGRFELRRRASSGARDGERVRTVQVEPPSRSDEATWVFLAAGFIVLAMIYVYGFHRFGAGEGGASDDLQRALLPYQVLFRDLPGNEQRIFRSMQEGAAEALRVRDRERQWPAPEALAGAGVPPFAPDALDKSRLEWTTERDGLLTNYLGLPSVAGAPAYLIVVQEPPPVGGEQPVPGVVDEEHQLLKDGTLVHVTFWKHAAAARPGLVAEPAAEGWQQIRVRSPFEELAEQK